MNIGIIYILKNKVNNKLYVGQTTNWSQRKRGHKSGNQYIDRALRKNPENFDYVLCNDIPIEFLDKFEEDMIEKLNTIFPNGYNFDSGGCKNHYHNKKSKIKISVNHADVSGKNNPMYGKHQSEEAKKIQSEKRKKYTKENHPNARKIICLNNLEVFNCVIDAENKYSILHQNIVSSCKNKASYAGKDEKDEKLVWSYYEDYLKMTKQEIKDKVEKSKDWRKGKNNPVVKSVICLNNLEIFDTITEAEKKYYFSRGMISPCCKGKLKFAGKDSQGNKFYWVYYKDYLKREIND